MKFVYFGYDFMLDSVLRLIREGHTLLAVYSFECDNIFNFNARTQALAQELEIPFTTNKPLPMDIDIFLRQGAEVFLAAGYPYKIPPILDTVGVYGLNFHPSLLPKGRGLMPTPHIIMHHPEVSGVTIHRLSEKFDDGAILMQKALPLSDQDDVETLSARIALCAPDMISDCFAGLPALWANASPQNSAEASHFPPPDESMRTLSWKDSVALNEKKGRAFGRYGCLARLNGQLYAVYNFKGWVEPHSYRPGTIACELSREIVVAVADGFLCLKELQAINS